MRKHLVILLFIELVAAVALGQMCTLRRSELDRTFAEWRQHPTAEARRAFERQKRNTEIQRWAFSGVVFAVLAGATMLVYRVRRDEPSASGDAGDSARRVPGSDVRRA